MMKTIPISRAHLNLRSMKARRARPTVGVPRAMEGDEIKAKAEAEVSIPDVDLRARATGDAGKVRAQFEEKHSAARRRSERLLGLLKKTAEELDHMAREDFQGVQRAFDGSCGCASSKAPAARKDDTRATPLVEPSEPEFFRDPKREKLTVRAEADAEAGSA